MAALERFALCLLSCPVLWLALLALYGAYILGGLAKLLDWTGALDEMAHFGLPPSPLFAGLTIVLELAAPLMILTGLYRWFGALALAGFMLMATFIANRFWEMAGPKRFGATNALFEHLGLVGAFVLVAWFDVEARSDG